MNKFSAAQNQKLSRISLDYYHIRLDLLPKALNYPIKPELKPIFKADTYYDFWTSTYGDKFFDMGTIVRLGGLVEIGLKEYYMERKGYKNLQELSKDKAYKFGIFQRFYSNTGKETVISFYNKELGYDLTTNKELKLMEELVANRHLYAHNQGVIDDKYIEDIKRITGKDLTSVKISQESKYPSEDNYYFEPLSRENFIRFIDGIIRFFPEFPEIK